MAIIVAYVLYTIDDSSVTRRFHWLDDHRPGLFDSNGEYWFGIRCLHHRLDHLRGFLCFICLFDMGHSLRSKYT